MFSKTRKYTSRLSIEKIVAVLNEHRDPSYKFSLSNRYDATANEREFKIKSMPASRRGLYREAHVGIMKDNHGQTEIEMKSTLHKAGPIIVIALFVLFMSSISFVFFFNSGEAEKAYNGNLITMIVFMAVMHVVFYLIFIQMFSWIAIKWIENTLELERKK